MSDEGMELVLLIGLPGSGKSSFFEAKFAGTHVQVSKDLLGKRHRDERVQLRIAEALDAGKPVVVDNCNVTVAERESVIRVAGSVPVHAYVFPFDSYQSIARNATRKGRKRVPLASIYTKAKYYVEPTWEEGFSRMFDVQVIDEMHVFVVNERQQSSNS